MEIKITVLQNALFMHYDVQRGALKKAENQNSRWYIMV